MNEDYSFLAELQAWGDLCQMRLDYEDLTDEQIHEIAIARDLAFVIGYDFVAELLSS